MRILSRGKPLLRISIFADCIYRMKKQYKNRVHKNQTGQTLIETLVAIFVLVMGVTTSVDLSISSYQAVDQVSEQVTGTSIARQELEAFKSIRDSNWKAPWDSLSDCSAQFGGSSGSPSQQCYQNWLGQAGHQLGAGQFGPIFTIANNTWDFTTIPTDAQEANPAVDQYALYEDPGTGIFSVNTSGNPTVYDGKVAITTNTAAPFDSANPQLDLVATVWWSGRDCPKTKDPTQLPGGCKILLETHLTNWRNY